MRSTVKLNHCSPSSPNLKNTPINIQSKTIEGKVSVLGNSELVFYPGRKKLEITPTNI